jgi:hypothetical protein
VFVPTATWPLPEDLIEIIEAYVQRHEAKFDEGVSDRLNDELLSIYQNDVAHTPPKYGAFMAILRRLRPLVGQSDKIFRWFDLLLPQLDHLSQEKGLAVESQGVVLDILTADDGNDTNSPTGGAAIPLAERLALVWLDECELVGKCPDVARNFKEKILRETLIQYGKKRPKVGWILLDPRFTAVF